MLGLPILCFAVKNSSRCIHFQQDDDEGDGDEGDEGEDEEEEFPDDLLDDD